MAPVRRGFIVDLQVAKRSLAGKSTAILEITFRKCGHCLANQT